MSGKRPFQNVAVLMGGPSAEREVSLHSGEAVAGGLREAGYDVVEIDVPDRTLRIPDNIEAVFVALHGGFGEDGEVQGLLDELGLPYTGSGPASSRAAFDKVISKRIFLENGIPTPEYRVLKQGGRRELPLPAVVKPACQGSSIGIHRVFSDGEWDRALADAFAYGPEVVVESLLDGKELTVGIVGTEPLPVLEIVAPDDWYDYGAKYTKGACRYLVPAPIDRELSRRCQVLSVRTFEALGCRGFARVDMRLDRDGEPSILELNTIPGFTETSLLPKAAAEFGLNFSALCDRIMHTASLPETAALT